MLSITKQTHLEVPLKYSESNLVVPQNLIHFFGKHLILVGKVQN